MITTTARAISYTPDGTQTVFEFPHAVAENNHLSCTVNGSAVTNFTTTGASDTGATVTFITAPAAGTALVITRTTPISQLVDYVPNEAFNAETHENALDKGTLIDQELRADLDAAIIGAVDVNGTLVVGGWGAFLHIEAGAVPAAPTSPATIPTLEAGVPAIVQEHWSAHNETIIWFYSGTAWVLKWRHVGPYTYTLKTEADLTAFLALSGDRSAEVSATIPITQAFTVPAEATIRFKAGGVLDFTAAAAECQWLGGIEAGTQRIFSGFTGTPAKTLNAGQSTKIQGYFGGSDRFPEWWGAVADFDGTQGTGPWTGTDCTEGIQYAIDSGIESSFPTKGLQYGSRVVLNGKRYLTTSAIDMTNRSVNLIGRGIFRTEIHPRHATAAFNAIEIGAIPGQIWTQYAQRVKDLNVRFSDDSFFTDSVWTGIRASGDVGESTEIAFFQCNGYTGSAINITSVRVLGLWIHDGHFGTDNPGMGSSSLGIYLGANADTIKVERCTINHNVVRNIVKKATSTASATTNSTTMTDTGAGFPYNVTTMVGGYDQASGVPQYSLVNVTQNDVGHIVSNTANDIVTAGMRDGTTWTSGDTYIIQTRLLPNRWTRIFRNANSSDFTFATGVYGGTDDGWPADSNVDTQWVTGATSDTAPNLGTGSVDQVMAIQILCHAGAGYPSTYPEWPHAGVFCYGTNGATISEMHIEGCENSIKVGGTALLSNTGVAAGYSGGVGPIANSSWEPTTAYVIGDSKIWKKVTYNCFVAHTSGAVGGLDEPGNTLAGTTWSQYWIRGNQSTAQCGRISLRDIHSDSGRTGIYITGMSGGSLGGSATSLVVENLQQGSTEPQVLDFLYDVDTQVQIGTGPAKHSDSPYRVTAVNSIARYTRMQNLRAGAGPFDLAWEISPVSAFVYARRLAAVTGVPNEIDIPTRYNQPQSEWELDATEAGKNVVLATLAAPRFNGDAIKLRYRDGGGGTPYGTATVAGTFIAGCHQELATAASDEVETSGNHDGGAINSPTVTLTVDTWASTMHGQKFTLGTKTYYLTPDGLAALDGEVDIGANLAGLQTNIVAAINGSDGINTAHPKVTAAAFATNACVITETIGSPIAGVALPSTETFTAGTNVFSSATLVQVLEDTSQSWGVNAYSAEHGYLVYNTTDGSVGTIISNTATTITVKTLSGGTDNLWDPATGGDAFIVVKAKCIKFQSTRGTATNLNANGQTISLRGQGGLWHPVSGDCYVAGKYIGATQAEERWSGGGTPELSNKDKVTVRMDLDGGAYTAPTMGPPEYDGAEKIIFVIDNASGNSATMTPANCNLRGVTTSIVFNSDLENIVLRGVAGKWVVMGGNATVS